MPNTVTSTKITQKRLREAFRAAEALEEAKDRYKKAMATVVELFEEGVVPEPGLYQVNQKKTTVRSVKWRGELIAHLVKLNKMSVEEAEAYASKITENTIPSISLSYSVTQRPKKG